MAGSTDNCTHAHTHEVESEPLKMWPGSRLSKIFLKVMSNGKEVNRKDQMDSDSERGLKEGQLWKTAATELLRRLNLTGSP